MIKVDMDASEIRALAAAGKNAMTELRQVLADEAKRLMEPYVPMMTGNLAISSSRATPGAVVYSAPYASRIYKGVNFNFGKARHPMARAQWDKAISAADVAKAGDDYVRRTLGRL
jgi:hypothetical protein